MQFAISHLRLVEIKQLLELQQCDLGCWTFADIYSFFWFGWLFSAIMPHFIPVLTISTCRSQREAWEKPLSRLTIDIPAVLNLRQKVLPVTLPLSMSL